VKVLLLSRYGPLGASSRVRYLQYLPYFFEHGVAVEVAPLFSDTYLRALYTDENRVREAFSGYLHRLRTFLRARRFDVVLIEKELFPFAPAWFERLLRAMGVPYVVDFDDAIFHRYDRNHRILVRWLLGRKIDAVMRHAAVVVAGNEYLAERARQAGAGRVEIVPTVVDTKQYTPQNERANSVPIVGWIGTPETSHYLSPLVPVFEALQREIPVRFVAVGARAEDFAGTPVETWPWSEKTEVGAIQQFDIGIMPLQDLPWERGKCGYKLLQYMACGVPVVASPVGVNREIVQHGDNGFLADTSEQWQKSLLALLREGANGRRAMGAVGRERVREWYSLDAQAPRLLEAVREAVC
jgi:glycosyltransferase involved in cell wall biosynthesis